MSPQPTQQEIDELTKFAKETEAKLMQTQEELNKLAKSNNQQKAIVIVASKMADLAPFINPMGWLGLSLDDIKRIKENMLANIAILIELLEVVADFLVELVEGIIDIFTLLGKKIVSIFERQEGTATIAKTGENTFRIVGNTGSVHLSCSTMLQHYGLPATAGPYAGAWYAECIFDGTDAAGNNRYRMKDFVSESSKLFIDNIRLKDLRQIQDIERTSFFTVLPNGAFFGRMHTRFVSSSWEKDVLGIPGTTSIKGQINNDSLVYTAEGEEFFWASYLIPGLKDTIHFQPGLNALSLQTAQSLLNYMHIHSQAVKNVAVRKISLDIELVNVLGC